MTDAPKHSKPQDPFWERHCKRDRSFISPVIATAPTDEVHRYWHWSFVPIPEFARTRGWAAGTLLAEQLRLP